LELPKSKNTPRFRFTSWRILANSEDERQSKTDEVIKQSLKEFSKRVMRLSTPFLESMLADLSMEIDFLKDQIAAEPGLYESGSGKSLKDRSLLIAKKKLQIAETEFRKRSSQAN
jgi:hypothetical protein